MKQHLIKALYMSLLLNVSDVAASEQGITRLLHMDLVSLMNVTVYSASKVEEKISDSSASITSYSANDITNFGYYNIGDLADITPGYSTHSRFGERILETRGQRASSFNNDRHLLLVDGVPIHHARNYKVPTEEELPLFFANKVEFIRGPASALYGTSAFYGVIDITSQEFEGEGHKSEIRITAGSKDELRNVMSNTYYNSLFGKSSINLGYSQNVASKDQVGITNNPSWKRYDDKESIFIYAKHQFDQGILSGLSLNTLYSRKAGGLGEFWNDSVSYEENNIIWETFVPFVKYERSLSDTINFNGFVKYNESREIGNYVNTPAGPIFKNIYESVVQDLELNGEFQFDINEKTHFISGVNYDARRERGWPDSSLYILTSSGWNPDYTQFSGTTKWFQTSSFYSQIRHEFDILNGLILTAGARYDKGKAENQKYKNLSPRLSLVQRVTDHVNVRLSYSSALRAPGIKETGLNNQGVIRVGSLSPETFNTKEASLIYHQDNLAAEATIFKNKTSDTITGFHISGENKFRNNAGTTETIGVEFNVKYKTDFGLDIGLNFSSVSSEDEQGADLADIPKQKANLILSYNDDIWSMPYTVSFINKWTSNYTVSNTSFEESGRHLVSDLNMRIQTSDNATFELQIRNLFDDNYRIPNANVEQVLMPGRAALISFVTTF